MGLIVSAITDEAVKVEPGYPPSPAALSYVTRLPDEVLEHLTAAHPPYRLHRSRTAGFAYYTCYCDCGANLGDHFLYKPDGPFCPLTAEDAADITVTRLPIVEPFIVSAEYSKCPPDLVALVDEAS